MEIQQLIQRWAQEEDEIPADRRQALSSLARLVNDSGCRTLAFICTHNSRRSQLAEVLVDLISKGAIQSRSAGTEATSFNHRMVEALRSLGIELLGGEGENPSYRLAGLPKTYWSKTVEALSGDHIAVMVCSEADANCPIVPGATDRFSLPYQDPKASDGSPQETEVYRAKVMEVGRELTYLVRVIARDSEL